MTAFSQQPKLGEPWLVQAKSTHVRGTAILRRKPHSRRPYSDGETEWVVIDTRGLCTISVEFPSDLELIERLSAASSFAHLLPKEERGEEP